LSRVTVLEGIQKSAEFLARKEVEPPRLQAELLLAHVLKLPRMQLYLNFERVLTPAQVDGLRELIRRRGRREPLQHIIGSTSFCGLEIAVNRHVLIPRPETELLAQEGWQFLNQLSRGDRLNDGAPADRAVRAPSSLDLGTGSGCVAIALAVNCPAAQVYAADLSPEALDVAIRNAASHRVSDRIHFLEGDGFAALPEGIRFDLIVSNPPYIPTAEIESLQPEVRDYDPRRALDGGPDGLEFCRKLAAESRPFLKPDGRIMLEFGDGQAGSVRQIFEAQNWIVEAVREDYNQHPRILIARLNG
jgi:release factor glutamine methyltransferase